MHAKMIEEIIKLDRLPLEFVYCGEIANSMRRGPHCYEKCQAICRHNRALNKEECSGCLEYGVLCEMNLQEQIEFYGCNSVEEVLRGAVRE